MSKFGELFFENCLIGANFSQKSFERVEIIFFLANKMEKNHPQKETLFQTSVYYRKGLGFRVYVWHQTSTQFSEWVSDFITKVLKKPKSWSDSIL
jgi:hypothetical protein